MITRIILIPKLNVIFISIHTKETILAHSRVTVTYTVRMILLLFTVGLVSLSSASNSPDVLEMFPAFKELKDTDLALKGKMERLQNSLRQEIDNLKQKTASLQQETSSLKQKFAEGIYF